MCKHVCVLICPALEVVYPLSLSQNSFSLLYDFPTIMPLCFSLPLFLEVQLKVKYFLLSCGFDFCLRSGRFPKFFFKIPLHMYWERRVL